MTTGRPYYSDIRQVFHRGFRQYLIHQSRPEQVQSLTLDDIMVYHSGVAKSLKHSERLEELEAFKAANVLAGMKNT